ncbi:MAG TPA: hypothetical protein VF150_01585 [Thermoanaerobaculia bacterium]
MPRTRKPRDPLPPTLALGLAFVLAAACLALAGCEDGHDIFFDDDPVATGRFTSEVVNDPGAGGHVDLDFRGVFDPGDLASDELVSIHVMVDSGDEAVTFQLDDDAGWSRTERLSTLTAHADYDEDDERFTLQARLTARDDAPRAMEARVEYRIRYWGSNSRRFTQEYVWREQVAF